MEKKLAYTLSEIMEHRVDTSVEDGPGSFLNALL
jgi:hypothetical protein